MKTKLLTILLFLPLLAIGQSDTTEPTELLGNPSLDLDKKINTTLINDTESHKSVLNIESRKSKGLSLAKPIVLKYRLLNEQDLEKMRYNPKPIKEFKKRDNDTGGANHI